MEQRVLDPGEGVRQRDCRQTPAGNERAILDFSDGIGNHHVGQAVTGIKRCPFDADNANGNRDVEEAHLGAEGLVSSAGDRQAIDRAGDRHRAARASVTGDGDGRAIRGVGKITKLLGGGRQRRYQEDDTQQETRTCSRTIRFESRVHRLELILRRFRRQLEAFTHGQVRPTIRKQGAKRFGESAIRQEPRITRELHIPRFKF